MSVHDREFQPVPIPGFDVDRLEHLFAFPHGRLDTSVWSHDTIDAEVTIVHRVAKIAAICPIFIPLIVTLQYALIDPIPDKAALQAVVFSYSFPILFEITGAVAH